MKNELLNKCKIFAVITLFIGACFIPSTIVSSTANTRSTIINQDTITFSNEGTEYWALLVAVGVYADDPRQNRPLMLEEVDDLYEMLLHSEVWSEDHIKVIKGEDATVSNIISGLRWLDKMEDSDDISLVFITTHGGPLGFDIPPFDEKDGTDELLVSYWGFAYSTRFIYDDELNFLLNRLESQGVCLIVDSCFAGGFNDPPNWIKTLINKKQKSVEKWMEDFAEDVRGQGRVILMASREDEVSFSGGFAPFLIDGLRGFADSNSDNVVTAEEAFYYTEPRARMQHPTIYDGYDGELPLMYLTESSKNSKNPANEQESVTTKTSDSTLNIDFSNENSIVCGFVNDADTGYLIEDALIYIQGYDYEWGSFENETTTDSNGFYSINVPACICWITVYADGYCSDQLGHVEIDENEIRWVNFSLYTRPPENSAVCGYITDEETGNPINGANIYLYWEGAQGQFYMNETVSDYSGSYFMNVAAGEISLEVEASGYFEEYLEEMPISDHETLWVNISLLPRPLENSVVCGYVADEETGNPINNVRVEFEWVDVDLGHRYQNETNTDSSGFYSINVAAGELYLDIRKRGYEFYDPYRHDTEENKVLWMNASLEEETIEVDIAKPLRAIYINNKRITPYNKARIVGKIDIEAYVYESWFGPGQAEKVEFFIDGDLKASVDTEPYTWTWNKITFGKHTIKVIAYDHEGKSASKEIEVWKFL